MPIETRRVPGPMPAWLELARRCAGCGWCVAGCRMSERTSPRCVMWVKTSSALTKRRAASSPPRSVNENTEPWPSGR